MRLVCLSRKECIGLLHLVIGGMALKNVLLLIEAFEFPRELDLFYHIVVTASLAFNSLFSGVATFFFNSKNSLAHTFIRLHNVCTISPSLYYLIQTHNVYYAPYYNEYIYGLYLFDMFDHELKHFDASISGMTIIIIIGGVVVILQGYAVYARAVVAFCRHYRPHAFQNPAANTN